MEGAPNRPVVQDPGVGSAGEQEGSEQSKSSRALGSVQDHTHEVTTRAAEEARGVVDDAVDRLHGEAERQTDQVREALRRTGSQLEALADGRVEDAGPLADHARRASMRAEELAGRMERLGFDGIVSEVSDYARRRPGRFLLMSAAAGVVVGRLGRNIRASQQQSSQAELHEKPVTGTTRRPVPQAGEVPQGAPARAGLPPGFGAGPVPSTGSPASTGGPASTGSPAPSTGSQAPAPGNGDDPLRTDRPAPDAPRSPEGGRDG